MFNAVEVPFDDGHVVTFKKMGMKVMVSSTVESVDTSGKKCKVLIKTSKGEETVEADIVLSAVAKMLIISTNFSFYFPTNISP